MSIEDVLKRYAIHSVNPVTPVNSETGKLEPVIDPKVESRRNKVLAMLEENPTIRRAFLTDTNAYPDHVVLTLAIRGVGSCELLIPNRKYDPFLTLELIMKDGIQ